MDGILRVKSTWPSLAALVFLVAASSLIFHFSEIFLSSLPYLFNLEAQIFDVSTLWTIKIDFKKQFPSDSLGAVTFHGAPWKPEVGRWLSGCHLIAQQVNVPEIISGKNCKDDCNMNGICNRELGICRCFSGFTGEGCSDRINLNCNHPATPEQPYGSRTYSTCSAYCDTTRAMCFCGEGTKYPNRPVSEECGFHVTIPSQPGAPKIVNWTKDDMENIFTTDSNRRGWCNVDPKQVYASKANFKDECHCTYDGQNGLLCEIPVQSFCINQCSDHGHCHGGFCQCEDGWYGSDCSIPSVLSSINDWPQWLQTDLIKDSAKRSEKPPNYNVVTRKKRPLIYVYDLPSTFHTALLEARHWKFHCVNRIYDNQNGTFWTDQLYGAQMALYESILASSHRTLNGDEADYFFVPVFDSCIIIQTGDSPHLSPQKHGGRRSSITLEYYKNAYDHISEMYPFWNRSSGRDHIWTFMWDEGACCAPKEIWNSTVVVHWGNTNTKHNYSTTAYGPDIWDVLSSDLRGNHPCFDYKKDIIIPSWKRPEDCDLATKLWERPIEKRSVFFYFNGNLGPAYSGRPEDKYSIGIRQKVASEFGSNPNKNGELGKQHEKDVIVASQRSGNYHDELASSIFCGVFPGDGWSGRMEDSILHGCIPVIIQDGILLPYENVMNYDSFAIRIGEDDVPNMIKNLRRISSREIELKRKNVLKIRERFMYRDSVVLEGERQQKLLNQTHDWAEEFSRLSEDDVFETVIQILHYKLHNDPWRREDVHHKKKDFGLPEECLK